MSTLIDELRADQGKPTTCAACLWISGLSAEQQKQWDAAMADRSFTHASIHRAIQRRMPEDGQGIGSSSVAKHRSSKHRVPRS